MHSQFEHPHNTSVGQSASGVILEAHASAEASLEALVKQMADMKRQHIEATELPVLEVFQLLMSVNPQHLRKMIKDIKARFELLRIARPPQYPGIGDIKMPQLPYFISSCHTAKPSVIVNALLKYDAVLLWRMHLSIYYGLNSRLPSAVDMIMLNDEMDRIIERILVDVSMSQQQQPEKQQSEKQQPEQRVEFTTTFAMTPDQRAFFASQDNLGTVHSPPRLRRRLESGVSFNRELNFNEVLNSAESSSSGSHSEHSSPVHSAHLQPLRLEQRFRTSNQDQDVFSLFSNPM